MPPSAANVASMAPDATAATDCASEMEAVLWARWHEHADAAAREELICRHLGYARIVAASYYGRRIHDEIEFEEFFQFASLGLVESVDRFDPGMGAQFKTFAARRMHGAILNGLERITEKQQQIAARQRLRKERLQSIKTPSADADTEASQAPVAEKRAHTPRPDALFGYLAEVGIGLALSCLLEGTSMVDDPAHAASLPDTHYQPIELRQLQQRVRDLVGRLSDQEQTVIRHHYLQERGFDEVATTLGVTKGRVAQIHRKALAALRAHLGAHRRCDLAW